MSSSTPAKRVEDMTPEERLQSLREFAEEKKYVRLGEDGTLPSGQRGMLALAFGGRMAQDEYKAPLAPPSYASVTGEGSAGNGNGDGNGKRRQSFVKRLLGKTEESKKDK